jgi:hypothetical protein
MASVVPQKPWLFQKLSLVLMNSRTKDTINK